jgi:hypothetical protein
VCANIVDSGRCYTVVRIERGHRIDSNSIESTRGAITRTTHNNNSALRGSELFCVSMNRQRRTASCLLGALGLAVPAMFGIPVTTTAQDIDNRPIYYMMLKSIENEFQAYSQALNSDLEERISRVRADYKSRDREIADELETLEAQRQRRESAFVSERDTLNARINAINEQIALRDGRMSEERRIAEHHSARYASDAQIEALTRRIAERLAEIESIRATYLSRLAATREARAALGRQFEEYMTAGDPLAVEIRSLEEDWQRFAEGERRKLKQLADSYAVDYAAYNKWLDGERADLEGAADALARLVESDREQRALHAKIEAELRDLVDEYNALVEVHSRAGPGDPGRDERALEFAALDERIAALQVELTRVRDVVVRVNEEFDERNRDYRVRYERFSVETRERGTKLAADLAEIDATRLAVEAGIDARRQEVDAQIRTLEAHISDDLEHARGKLEALNARLIEDFGRDHEGLDVAITQVLEDNDDKLLYTTAGAPRFDLSRPLTAAVYTAIEQVSSDRRRIDARIVTLAGGDGGGAPDETSKQAQTAVALEQEGAALSSERQRLLEAHSAFAREQQSLVEGLGKRRRISDKRFADARTLLGQLYSARASLTRSELQAVQRVLVAAARGVPGTASDKSEHARLVSELREISGRMDSPVNESMHAQHVLLDRLAETAATSAHAPLDWQSFVSRTVTSSRELTGEDKAALASAWLVRFRRQPRFAAIADELDASGAVKNGREALANLFMAGVVEHATITEQRLEAGGIGIQVSILGRAYQLGADGSLEALPRG